MATFLPLAVRQAHKSKAIRPGPAQSKAIRRVIPKHCARVKRISPKRFARVKRVSCARVKLVFLFVTIKGKSGALRIERRVTNQMMKGVKYLMNIKTCIIFAIHSES